MSIWLIDPHGPLIFRDGRPFDPTPGVRAASRPFPLPSVVAGAVRQQALSHPDGGFTGSAAQARTIAVAGPLLVRLKDDPPGTIETWYAPAPADALLLQMDDGPPTDLARRKQLAPLAVDPDATSDLPQGLAPVGAAAYDPSKPHPYAPRFWTWAAFRDWLLRGTPSDDSQVSLPDLGLRSLQGDPRTHVQIAPQTQTAQEGALFQTRGLELVERRNGELRRLALAVETQATLRKQHGSLGGERRLVRWREGGAQGLSQLLPCPPEVRRQIHEHRHCRLILLTPAYFAQGYRPARLLLQRHGVTPQLIGAAVERAQIFSGWDLATGQAKPSRRLAPEGSVLFVQLACAAGADLDAWIDEHWMGRVSDDDPAPGAEAASWFRDAGFGLTALGAWDGRPVPLKAPRKENTDAPTA